METSLFKRFLSAQGRINRSEYWSYTIIYSLAFLLAMSTLFLMPDAAANIAGIIILVIYIIISGILVIKRVHDYGESAFYALLFAIPVVGIYIVFTPGDTFENQYGSQPSPVSSGLLLATIASLGAIILLMFLLVNSSLFNE